jgi:hypothetical protein
MHALWCAGGEVYELPKVQACTSRGAEEMAEQKESSMKTIRRRKFKSTPRALNVQVEVETYIKLERIAGRRSLGWAVEKLVKDANTTTKQKPLGDAPKPVQYLN